MDNATSALNPTHGLSFVARVEGVLFDIDDTLVDLNSAAIKGFDHLTAEDFRDVPAVLREHVARDYADDGAGAYERYMAGELTFLGQRAERIQRAYGLAGVDAPPAEGLGVWSARFEEVVQDMWAPFPDVHDCLDALDALGIPYGAVSNNVENYQRNKLRLAGLAANPGTRGLGYCRRAKAGSASLPCRLPLAWAPTLAQPSTWGTTRSMMFRVRRTRDCKESCWIVRQITKRSPWKSCKIWTCWPR